MKLTNKLPKKNVNLSDASPLGNFFKSLVGGLVVLAVLYFGMVWTLNLIIPLVSPETETWLGNALFQGKYNGGNRTDRERQLQKMLDSLAATGPELPYRPVVHVEESDEVNAYALPGGNILMLTGLLDEVESDNELAFILGHELGHIANRDHLRGLGRALTITSLNLLCSQVAGVEILPDALVVYDRGVSRGQETAADRFGLDRLHAINGHVAGSLAFFERQKNKRAMPAWAAYFSTHPKDDERMDDLKEYAREKGYRFD